MVEMIFEKEEEMQNKIKLYLKKKIKKELLLITWEEDALCFLMDRNKMALTLEEKTKLKFLITIGTPASFRSKLWFICSGAKKDQFDNQTYYEQLKRLSKEVPSLFTKQINKDITRTPKGNSNDSNFHQKLRRILICFSIRNSSIGYCQGFNFICSRLLGVLKDEEDTFWVFVELIEEILPINYYSELAGIIIDTAVITSFLQKYFPQLLHFFESNENMVNTFIHKSLLGLFTQDYDEETSLFIWDFLFLEGNIVLIKACLAVFGCLSTRLSNISDDDIESLFTVFSSEIRNIKRDSSILLHSLAIKQFEFNEKFLESKRGCLADSIIENIDKQNLEKTQEKLKKNTIDFSENEKKANECNEEFPYCFNDYYFENVDEVIPFLVIHTKNNPVVFQEYFFKTINEIDPYMIKKAKESDLVIERRPHYCWSDKNGDHFEKRSSSNRKYSTKSQTFIDESIIEGGEEEDYRALYEKMKKTPLLKCGDDEGLMDGFNPKPFIDFYNTPEA